MKLSIAWMTAWLVSICGASMAVAQTPDASSPNPHPAPAAPQAAPAAPQAAPAALPDGTPIAACVSPVEGMSCIPGGAFIRGSNNDPHVKCKQPSYNKKGVINTYPPAERRLPTYYTDKTQVTVEAYKA